MQSFKHRILIFCVLTLFIGCAKKIEITGELKKWHKVTLTFKGPQTTEMADPNPFLDYRLNVKFSHDSGTLTVPGYFAADGNAANTSSTEGDKWCVHFAPNATGMWTYEVSFKQGENIAVLDDPNAGQSAGYMDGKTGTFKVKATDKTGRDFRSKGRLQYVGKHYLQFAETGDYFLKAGADAPENLLAYKEFDGKFKHDGHKDDLIKTWEPHIQDWQTGDPVWQDGKGKGIIGALNYLASKGMNVFSFLTLNIKGDDRNVFPYVTYDDYLRMDVSKLAQWEIVFEHADHLGLYLHFKTQEAENQGLLDNGDLGVERKLYYRELIARFSHHLAMNWNLGEENGTWGNAENRPTPAQTTQQRRAIARYFYEHDPYQNHIVIHNGQPFDDLLGDLSKLTGVSVQTNKPDFSRVHDAILEWRTKSVKANKPWVVAVDEPGDAQHALVTDGEDPTHDDARKNALWGALMAGAAGIEWYFGYKHPHSDLTCQDWRTRENMWNQSRFALDFFSKNSIPFWEMRNGDILVAGEDNYCFYLPRKIYILYLKNGGEARVNLEGFSELFEVKWFNPRTGSFADLTRTIQTGRTIVIDAPPVDPQKDWVVLLTPKD